MGKVRDLLALNQDGYQVEVLQGREHLSRRIGSLCVLHRLDEPLRVGRGDLILVPGETLGRGSSSGPWLDQLCRQRPSAVLIHLRGADDTLAGCLQPQAEVPGLLLLLVRTREPWQRLVRKLYHIILRGAETVVASRNLLEEFMDLAGSSGADYAMILQRARAELGSPLLFLDRGGVTLAGSEPIDAAVQEALAAGVRARSSARPGGPLQLRGPDGVTYPAHAVTLGQQLFGYLVLVAPTATHPDHHSMVVHHASMALGFVAMEARAARDAVRQYQRLFLGQMLSGRWSEPDGLQLEGPALPLQPEAPFVLLLARGEPAAKVKGGTAGGGEGPAAGATGREPATRLVPAMEAYLLGLGLRAIATTGAGGVVALCQDGAVSRLSSAEARQQVAQGLVEVVQAQRLWTGVRIAVSGEQRGWAAVPAAFREAHLALLYGPVAWPGEKVLLHEALGPYLLLGAFAGRPEGAAFCRQILGPLLHPDQRELPETLSAYFQANMNVEECARSLFIHPNTVRYRLRRVHEITGLAVQRADQRFQLELAVRLLPFAGPGEPGI